jgi:LPXTG-motif cell wall-anchored protein
LNQKVIDEIEIDAPVPFNVPIEFEGEPRYGEHDITITLRYKDSTRDEIFLTHDQTITVNEPSNDDEDTTDPMMIVIPIILIAGAAFYIIRRRKKATIEAS